MVELTGAVTVDEGTAASYTVALTPSGVVPTADLTVDYQTTDGTAGSFSLTLSNLSGGGGSASVGTSTVTTTITEVPAAPGRPQVTALDHTSLRVTWQEPGDGGAAITGYVLRYRAATAGGFTTVEHAGTARVATLKGLAAATRYQVQVQATNRVDQQGPWSPAGTATTREVPRQELASNAPEYWDRDGCDCPLAHGAPAHTRTVAENTAPGVGIGAPVPVAGAAVATRYALTGTDAGQFAIAPASGQLQTREVLDYEARAAYVVEVVASDGSGSSTVSVQVLDVNERPQPQDDGVRTAENRALTVAVLANDADPEGDRLRVVEVAAPAHGRAVIAAGGSEITYTPEADFSGEDRFAYTVSDGELHASATVQVTVQAAGTEQSRVNRGLLPELTRAAAASTTAAVRARIEQAATPPGPSAALSLINQAALYQRLQADEQAWRGQAAFHRVWDGLRLLAALSGPVEGAEDGAEPSLSEWALWGSGDYTVLSGGQPAALHWDGRLVSAHVGIDARTPGDALLGLAVSWVQARLDYTDGADVDLRGAYASDVWSLRPYLSWRGPRLEVWSSVGFGWGAVEVSPADVAAGGVAVSPAAADNAGGWAARDAVRGARSVTRWPHQPGREWRRIVRVEFGGRRRDAAAADRAHVDAAAQSGGTPRAAVGVGGTTDTGGGGRRPPRRRRRADRPRRRGRRQREIPAPAVGSDAAGAWPGAGDARGERAEWGVGGLVLVQPGAGGRGLALSVAPEWGEPRSGVPELWQRGVRALPAITTSGGRVTAELGFGVATAGGTGLLTPFAGLTLAPEGMHSYRAGTHLTIGDGVGVSVQAEHRQQAGEPPERVLKLVGRIDLEVDDER